MSLVHLVKDAEIRALLDPILQQFPQTLDVPLKVPAQRPRGMLVGTAFDYAVRFELQRRCPHAKAFRWIAEESTSTVAMATPNREIADRYQRVVDEARSSVGSYLVDPQPTATVREDLAKHALRLARLDAYCRNRYLDPEPEKIEPGDLPDLLALLEIVPWQDLVSPTTLWLNPSFGRHSRRVGGADADLISGDRLLDLKATTKPTLQADLRQVLGYLILARAARGDELTFPDVTTVGIYYARHGFLWILPRSVLAEQREFGKVEERFFERSDEIRKVSRIDDTAKAKVVNLDESLESKKVAEYEIAAERYDGWFAHNAGNKFRGRIIGHQRREGFITIELAEPTTGRLHEQDIPLAKGQIMALGITNATKVLLGYIGKGVRGTLIGCSTKEYKLFQAWKLEVDESTSCADQRHTGHEESRTPGHLRKRAVTKCASPPAFPAEPTRPTAAKTRLKPKAARAKPMASREIARLKAEKARLKTTLAKAERKE